MSYVPRTLAAEIKAQGRLSLDRCVEIGLALTEALAHLHGQGLVHRDIKPSNIIFVGGVPKLADVGLVASVGEARSFVGTEGFIPPEGPGTPQADLYSLGILFYVMGSGKSHRDFPEPPDDLAARPDCEKWVEFQAIIHRACAPDPRARYASAEAIKADLILLQDGSSVLDRHARQRAWTRGKRALLVCGMLASVLVLAWLLTKTPNADYEGKPSSNAEAEDLFEHGQHEFRRKTAAGERQAVQDFSKAVQLDPTFAKAYAWLAASQCWVNAGTNRYWEFLPQARVTAEHALTLDPRLAKAHLALAWNTFFLDWNTKAAEEHFGKARKYAPHDPDTYEWRGLALSWLGRNDEAMKSVNIALELEHNDSMSARHFHAGILRAARRFEEAISEFRKILQMEPGGPLVAYSGYAEALILAGHYQEGIEARKQAEIKQNGASDAEATKKAEALLAAYRADPPNGYWRQLLTWAEAENTESDPYELGALHARLGHTNQALHFLLEAERLHDTTLWASVMNDPAVDSLRSLPTFKALVKRLQAGPTKARTAAAVSSAQSKAEK